MNKPLPRQVQRQLDEAKLIEEQMQGANARVELDTPAEPPTPEPEPAPAVEPPKAVQDDAALWKQRYLTLQGEFNSKMPRLQAEVRDLTAKLESAETRLNAVKTEPPKLITEKDAEEYGADMLEMIDRKVRQELAAREAPLVEQLNDMKRELAEARQALGDISQVQVQSAEERFYAALEASVPNYREIDTDPNWLAWLNVEDTISGETRQDLLTKAATAGRADRVAAIFQSYLRESQPPVPQVPAGDNLQRQVAPARNAAAPQAAGTQPQGRTYTVAEVEFVFDQRNRSKYSEADYAALVNDVNLAIAQNRVVR